MTCTPDGHGYWMVASDGGVLNFEDAPALPGTNGGVLNAPVVTMALS